MIEITKLNRFKYAAMLLGAMAVAGTPLAYPAIATAERVLDVEQYDACTSAIHVVDLPDFAYWDLMEDCCDKAGGTWNKEIRDCQAPPGDSKGSRQLPGTVHIPSDIGIEPVTKAPPRPIRVPSDIATASTVSQAPA
jgi:hypothetical protein